MMPVTNVQIQAIMFANLCIICLTVSRSSWRQVCRNFVMACCSQNKRARLFSAQCCQFAEPFNQLPKESAKVQLQTSFSHRFRPIKAQLSLIRPIIIIVRKSTRQVRMLSSSKSEREKQKKQKKCSITAKIYGK